ncbi:Modulator of FtsH protease HflC [Aliiroseovarius sp. xm-m-379]|uniref:protease modulator HflC n=1 Tax=Aliiroseovarius TaxID=1658781 RepID=UPI001568CB30|nr:MULTISPECIES: protease modulator HflC [Aliiroseovarius]NRP12402.1 Modulator of FtsH protease HflC [Aliiroseovarius sp. xm-d-517]NRP24776.1 Modulator of FtsH protease HflC [Aliiroseovarius sp. xm-m-379]NRP30589.1 Modulator of FtsH protease HflC [Aliiroseovarius sp. xm-m-314]NRP33575.1 Modulator of FtsH protease HflC [Aliiroseovarius sp. xm-a-104]NRP40682.1 Modulator of FtsH protease HflC [Aliiroseovarius sp. xm-m-339-2]
MRKTQMLIGVAVVAVVAVLQAVYIVDERETALKLRFGEVKEEVRDPGLYFKVPLIDEIVKYDDRILPLDTRKLEVTPADGRRLEVDAFARWRITDAKEFRRSVGAGGIAGAASRLERILNAELRAVLGKVNSGVVLSADRILLMNQIRDRARSQAQDLGIEVIDVRIKSADLPKQNLEATFERMRAERQRLAADEIARGNEAAQRLRATADRTVVETTSEARKNAEIIRGEADARRNAILAEALGRDEEFYAFLRSLQAYEASLSGENSSLVISPDSEFFDYLKSDEGRK